MFLTAFDPKPIPPNRTAEKQLAAYRFEVAQLLSEGNTTRPEMVCGYPTPAVVTFVEEVCKPFKKIQHLVVVGIGGSSLGLEAVHAALGQKNVTLSVLDMVTPAAITELLPALAKIKKATGLAVCVITKSGSTTETLANASVLLRVLEEHYGEAIYTQTIFIGDPSSPLTKTAKKLGVTYVPMPKAIGGRYSVATEVGLVPLALLGHDVAAYAKGLLASAAPAAEEETATRALHLYSYMRSGYRTFTFFAFEARLMKLGAWYRQLMAESLGKATDRADKPVTIGFLPTIATPVELHSIGQLYFSGFKGVYTEFVSIDEDGDDYKVGPTKLAPQLKKFTLEEISAALYGGVVAAYKERDLPYRAAVLSDDLPYALGRYMGAAMLETMYLAHLMNVNAFDQPNVEIYKQKTREILGL